MAVLSDELKAKLNEPNFWIFTTVGRNGTPTASPVWIDVDDSHVLVNTAVGRLKERNVQANPNVALTMQLSDNPYNYFEIRGRVVERIEGEPADDSINKLSKKYLGQDVYPFRKPGEQRVLLRIEPTKVTHYTG